LLQTYKFYEMAQRIQVKFLQQLPL